MRPPLLTPLLLSFFFFFISLSLAQVPSNETFKFVNEGEFGDFAVEYGGNYRVLRISNSPFQLAFYNTTPNAYTLSLRMAILRSESTMRWVWEANRGRPVRENATFSLAADGNLVLADSDGSVVWQSNTANKGVVGFKLLPNGNMVLLNSNGKFLWQSFDSPTDTLLVGQSLNLGGAIKLTSRASEKSNINGPYSLVMERKALSLYYKSPNSPKPLRYFASSNWFTIQKGALSKITLNAAVEADQGFATELTLNYEVTGSTESGGRILTRPKYNSTLTFLRLGIDGNLRLITYNDKVDWSPSEVSFTLLDRDSIWENENECQLPGRCGQFGLCEENQCVACPTENGLLGWSKRCEAKKVGSCDPKRFHYYKMEGVDHFLSNYNKGEGPMGVKECEKKCDLDCKCLGYFYQTKASLCWVANELKTLIKVANSTHLGFIKTPNKMRKIQACR